MSPPRARGLHLFIVGERKDKPEAIIDDVATKQVKEDGRARLLRRCGSPEELLAVVRAALEPGELVATLDIYDHAAAGIVELGSGVLFCHDGRGQEIARALHEHLTADAQVRLLGCNTAMLAEGQKLLRLFLGWLGERRTVFGTIHNTEPADFGETGMLPHRAEKLLFSSLDAAKGEAPTLSQRERELLLRPTGSPRRPSTPVDPQ